MPAQTAPKFLQPAPAWTAILSLVVITALCVVAQLGGLLRYGFPAGCFLVGAFLYWRYPLLYIGFTWWVWFLSAFVRRLVDVQAGWLDPNPVLLAPFLVTILSTLAIARQLPKAIYGNGVPFVLCILGVVYGLIIGVISNSPQAVVVPLLNWLPPITFGYYLFSQWRQFPAVRQLTLRVFLWGVLVMGAYGIVQFLIAPRWDRFWLENLPTQAFGSPEPLGIRVFSTMQSPQPFAAMLLAGLFLLFAVRSPLKLSAAAAGYLSFLLSLARSAWLSWFVGIAVFLPSLKSKLQIRLVITLLAMMLVVLPLTAVEPFATVINSRFQSFFAGSGDTSFVDRAQGYSDLLVEALSQVAGQGLGFTLEASSIGSNDSGILTLLFTLGWVGTLPYLAGLLLLIISLLRAQEATFDPFVSASRAIAIATFSQISLNNAMLSSFGMVLWGFIGLAMAARQYYAQAIDAQPTRRLK